MRLLIVQSCVPTHGCLSTASARISALLPAFCRGECDQRVDQAIKDGVNVVIWFSLTFENRAEALITSSVAPQCVQDSVKRLKAAGLEAVHLISVGGWNVPHPDTKYSGAEWYDKFKKFNKAASGAPAAACYSAQSAFRLLTLCPT